MQRVFCAVFLFCFTMMLPSDPIFAESATVHVNPAVRHQKLTGWGVAAQSGEEDLSFPLYADTLFGLAVEDLGITRLTLELRSGLENTVDYWSLLRAGIITQKQFRCYRYATVNDNTDSKFSSMSGFQFADLDWRMEKVILPFKKKLQESGSKLQLNLQYIAFTSQMKEAGCPSGLRYDHTDPNEYAEFIDVAFRHLKTKYGVVPTSVELILEPDNTPFWKGSEIGEALVAVSRRLKNSGFQPAFIAPSVSSMTSAIPYLEGILSVPGAGKLITEFSYHRYGAESKEVLEKIASKARMIGAKTAMLEKIGADYRTLHEDLKVGNVSSWTQFTLAFTILKDNGGKLYIIDTTDPAHPQITLSKRAKLLRQYFKFLKFGAQRVQATTDNLVIDPLAFINPGGKYVVVVKAKRATNITVQGVPAGKYGIKYTTRSKFDADKQDIVCHQGCQIHTAMPDQGVLTIFAK